MTNFEPGDILLVPFLFTDLTSAKQRPTVVVSNARYNGSHPGIILAPITSQLSGRPDEAYLSDW